MSLPVVAFACALILSACTTTQPYEVVSPRQVPLADSQVSFSAGSVALRGVVETKFVNAIEQTISIDTSSKSPGQNYIKVQYFKTKATSPVMGGLQDVPLAQMDMAGEARGIVNYADMKLSPYFVQNTYGPFGYSMGRTATGDTCMYAWQRIPPPRVVTSVDWRTVNVRALICASDRTEQQLLDVMMQLHLKGVAGPGRAEPADIGTYGSVISPFATGPANVLPDIQVSAPVVTRSPVATTVDQPVPGSTIVPAPNGNTTIVPGPTPTPAVVVPGPRG